MSKKELERIEKALKLGNILDKAKQNYSWSDSNAQKALEWYVKHWYLCIKHPSQPLAAISKSADDLWHQHILDTRKYATDCQQVAGTFLNHTPIYGEPTDFEIAAYKSTVNLYKKEFKALPADIGRTSGDYSYRS